MKRTLLCVMLLSSVTAFAQTFSFNGIQTTLGSETIASSATPVFTLFVGTSYNVLTANVTSFTLPSGTDGQRKTICWKQGSGPFTVAPPANVHGFFTVGTTNADYNCQSYVYNSANTIWLAVDPGVINE